MINSKIEWSDRLLIIFLCMAMFFFTALGLPMIWFVWHEIGLI